MEAIGVLAGGVAHDFNNLLTVMNGYCEILLNDQGLAPASRQMVREIHRAGDNAAALTRQLLAFSRKQVLAPQVLDLNALVRESAKMLRRLIGADIDLDCALDPALGRIKADPGQIEQVVMNLVVNARDAMPTGGKLTIETHNVELGLDYCMAHLGVEPGSYVQVAVTDTGVGMDAATQARIFEPFFTTKDPGKGTGLGLSTVHGIVRQTGGHLQVYSELGRGTTFKIYLPLLAEDASTSMTASVTLDVPRGNETLLLAEDDDAIRNLVRIALESCGYTVLVAADGEDALKVSSAYKSPVDLLVTDVVMPRMSGRELVERLSKTRPAIRVLYVSGYTDDAIVRHGVVAEGVAFLNKPFTPTTLARKVREVLDAAS
jgi:CheY-like chemotaxis protein